MIKIRLFAVTAFVVLTFCPTSIRGDTLSGSVFYDGLANGVFTGSFNMSFDGTSSVGTTFGASVSGSTINDINAPRLLSNEHGGTSVNLGSSAFLDPTDFRFDSSVRINGISYSPSFVGVLITSNFVTIPFTTDPTIVLMAPCLVHVDVSGVGAGQGTGANGICNANLTLVRTGTDSLGFGTYTSESVSYELASLPTPEPATSVLLGAGLAGIAIKVRKRRKPV